MSCGRRASELRPLELDGIRPTADGIRTQRTISGRAGAVGQEWIEWAPGSGGCGSVAFRRDLQTTDTVKAVHAAIDALR